MLPYKPRSHKILHWELLTNKFKNDKRMRTITHIQKAALLFLFFLGVFSAQSQHFITTWDTQAGDSGSREITIPISGDKYDVDIGNDGTFEFTNLSGTRTIDLGSRGIHTIAIRRNNGAANGFAITFNGSNNPQKLLSIDKWGDNSWISMSNAFDGCTNLNIAADAGVPDLSRVTSFYETFKNATSLNQDLDWDVSNVDTFMRTFQGATNFNGDISNWQTGNGELFTNMFSGASNFNQDISNWDMSKARKLTGMFQNATSFNQNIGGWNFDADEIDDLSSMFSGASNFNQDISGWNLLGATNLNSMFQNATSFNQNIPWNMSTVTNMQRMFKGAVIFNQNISNWNVSNVKNMLEMFHGAMSFNQNLSGWDISSITNMTNMFTGAANFSWENYDSLLNGWSVDDTSTDDGIDDIPTGITFGAPPTTYCDGVTGKNTLTNAPYSWDISGDLDPCGHVWTGAINTAWNTAGNWSSNTVPGNSDDVFIPANVLNYPTATGAVTVNSMTINAGASFIAQSTFNGTVTYKRNLVGSKWYLISSPVQGIDEDDFVLSSNIQTSPSNSGRYAFGHYNTNDNTWSYYTNYNPGGSQGTFDAVLESGIGYSTMLAATGSVDFTGTIMNASLTPIDLETTGSGFNLIGNPFTSFVSGQNILSQNSSVLKSQTLWVWNALANAGAGGYETKVTIDNFDIAPGQAFFVQSSGTAGSLGINTSFQRHQSTDTFSRNTDTRPEIHVNVKKENFNAQAKVYYIEGATTGFDNGYDGTVFGLIDSAIIGVCTHLVTDSVGDHYAIQSLPPDSYEDMIIPVGILNGNEGDQITITIDGIDLPAGINIYLEDKESNTFTLLNDVAETYEATLSSDVNGIGRFYLHTTYGTLSTNDEILSSEISIYTTDSRNLRVHGITNGENARVDIHNILGQKMLSNSFQGSTINDIALPNLKAGIYLISLKTESGSITKKIVLK